MPRFLLIQCVFQVFDYAVFPDWAGLVLSSQTTCALGYTAHLWKKIVINFVGVREMNAEKVLMCETIEL